jgi:hypothetical protein
VLAGCASLGSANPSSQAEVARAASRADGLAHVQPARCRVRNSPGLRWPISEHYAIWQPARSMYTGGLDNSSYGAPFAASPQLASLDGNCVRRVVW